MRDDLGRDAGLGAQGGDGDDGREQPADAAGARGPRGRVGEEGPVVGLQDDDGEVWVGEGELGDEFVVEGGVDGVPEPAAAGEGLCV